MDVKDKEIWVGENRLYLSKDNILHVIRIGDIDEKTATAIKDASFKLVNLLKGNVDVLVDLNRSGKGSPEARQIWKEISEEDRFRKVALWGLHPVASVLASFVIGSSQKKDFRFFKTKEEALTWLKE